MPVFTRPRIGSPIVSGAAGAVLYVGANSVFANNINALWIDESTGRTLFGGGDFTPSTLVQIYDSGTPASSQLKIGPGISGLSSGIAGLTIGTATNTRNSILMGNTSTSYAIINWRGLNSDTVKALDIHTYDSTMAITLQTDGGNVGVGLTAPTARVHLAAGTTSASTAPLKFTSGSLLSSAEAGAVEFLTDAFYGTITTGAARKTFAFLESPVFTTQITTPLVIGGTGTTSTLTLRSTSGVGTTGADIIFQTGTNGATEAMRILNSGFVGIGISPLSLLHLYSTGGSQTAAALFIDGAAAGKPYISFQQSSVEKGFIQFQDNGASTDYLTFGPSTINFNFAGKVGIGKTLPTVALDVVGSFNPVTVTTSDSSGYVGIQTGNTNTGVANVFTGLYGTLSDTSNNVISAGFFLWGKEQSWTSTASTQDSYWALHTALNGSTAEKVRVTSDGYMGIGITPTNQLQVKQLAGINSNIVASLDTSIDANARGGFQVWKGAAGAGTKQGYFVLAGAAGTFLTSSGASDLVIGASSSQSIWFGNIETGTTTYGVITSGGQWGLGRSAPGARLDVLTASTVQQIAYFGQLQAVNTVGGYITFMAGTAGTTARGYLGFAHTGSGTDTLFTGEIADAFCLRAEGALQMGAGGNNLVMTITSGNNVGIKTATFGTSASAVLGIANGTEPGSSPADMVQLYSVDLSAGNATLGLRTETAVVTEAVVSDRTLSIKINGTVYKICLKA